MKRLKHLIVRVQVKHLILTKEFRKTKYVFLFQNQEYA